ncbi:hypothetical protein GTO89_13640 [Heliobacterium gestii]|uniref:Uncharacterized protein n=1 Tax=Heliomicrobium gestii TaxID=2699 RepID=A0A845LMG3_HELGE|nr:hypothetical protein [Heliomicrobium gestii]MBM7867683.1 hypothetical protein [Heliomicrobium gestii]MZP44076.1 hypothetical protein [Heliomicrobium gestii]
MSAFLGPIHYWLYNKIRRVVEREQWVYEKAAALCSDTAEELRAQAWQTYGEPLPDVALETLIDQGNIHGWLQRQITIAETREAALIKALIETCGEGGREAVESAFREHGAACGQKAAEESVTPVNGADQVYKLLNNYLLNGMPCDQADMVTENGSDKVCWETTICLQEGNWRKAGVDEAFMKRLYQFWIGAFVEAVNPDFTYRQTADTVRGDRQNRHEIAGGGSQ